MTKEATLKPRVCPTENLKNLSSPTALFLLEIKVSPSVSLLRLQTKDCWSSARFEHLIPSQCYTSVTTRPKSGSKLVTKYRSYRQREIRTHKALTLATVITHTHPHYTTTPSDRIKLEVYRTCEFAGLGKSHNYSLRFLSKVPTKNRLVFPVKVLLGRR